MLKKQETMWNDNTPPLTCGGQISLSKINEICSSAIPNQTSTISMHKQVWWQSIDIYSSYHAETKIWMCGEQVTLLNIYEICPLAIPNQTSTIPMHIPSLVKIDWYLLKLFSGKENMDMWWADKSIKYLWNLPISNPKPDLQSINAHTKFSENRLILTQVIVRKRKYGHVLGR